MQLRNVNTSLPFERVKSSAFARRRAAFSLVEVVLALGICAFALVALFGMLPVGLKSFQDAMDTTTRAQIANQVIGDALLANYTAYIATPPAPQYFGETGNPAPKAEARYTATVSLVPLNNADTPPDPAYPLQNLLDPFAKSTEPKVATSLLLTITAQGAGQGKVNAYRTLLVRND